MEDFIDRALRLGKMNRSGAGNEVKPSYSIANGRSKPTELRSGGKGGNLMEALLVSQSAMNQKSICARTPNRSVCALGSPAVKFEEE